jgi:hypothetical protein
MAKMTGYTYSYLIYIQKRKYIFNVNKRLIANLYHNYPLHYKLKSLS